MTHNGIDPELLGVFLDGSATAAERAAIMQLAATSPRAMRQLREAVATHGELTGAPVAWPVPTAAPLRLATAFATPRPRAELTKPTSGWRRRHTVSLALLAAAALAVAFAVPSRWGSTSSVSIGTVARLDGASGPGATGPGAMTQLFGPGWNAAATDAVRSGEQRQGTAEQAFITGVWAARFEVASVARDTAASMSIVDELRVIMRDVAGVAPVLAQLRSAARDTAGSSDPSRIAMVKQLRLMSGDERCFDLGLWRGAADMVVLRSGDTTSAARTSLAVSTSGCQGETTNRE